MHNLEYHERLHSLKLYSIQRRMERYRIIYVWKVIEGLVSNCTIPITTSISEHRRRSCISSHVNLGRQGTIAYNSFRWCSIRLFNKLLRIIRNISICSVGSFKSQLDSYLSNIADRPGQPGFNNSLDSGDCYG